MKRTFVSCDVKRCGEEAHHEVLCCTGWMVKDKHGASYRKLERPLDAEAVDLCEEHWKQWSRLTCKFLKMDREDRA